MGKKKPKKKKPAQKKIKKAKPVTDDASKDKQEEKKEKEREEKKKKQKNVLSKWGISKVRDMFNFILQNKGRSTVNREEIVSRLEALIVQCELYKSDQKKIK